MRALSISVPLNEFKHLTPVVETQTMHIATEFRFIDIGCGVPAPDQSLHCLDPVTL